MTPAQPDAVEDQHPAAPEPERLAGAGVAVHRVEHPGAEHDQGHADDAGHDRVEPVRQERPEREGCDPESDDDRAVAEGVERPEADGLDLVPGQERLPRRAWPLRARGSPRPVPTSWARTSALPPCAWWSPEIVRCCSWWAASAAPAAAAVLVMSVIAAMWSQSIPWRIPRTSPVTRIPTAAGSKEGTKVVPVLRSALRDRLARSGACCNMSHQQRDATLRPWIRGSAPAGSPGLPCGSASACRSRRSRYNPSFERKFGPVGMCGFRQGLASGEREPRMLLRPRKSGSKTKYLATASRLSPSLRKQLV